MLLVAAIILPLAASAAASPFAESTASKPSQSDLSRLEESAATAHGEGRFHEAAGIYTRVLKVEPRRASALLGRAPAYEMLDRPDEARQDYRNALLSDPGNYRAMESLAGLLERSAGHRQEALELYREALKLDPRPEWKDYLRFCIAILGSRGRPKHASAVGCWHEGNERLASGDSAGAFSWYTRALSLDPRMFQAHFSRGLIRLNKGDFETAIADFDEALRISPRLRGGLVQRALACERMGDSGQAVWDLTQAVTSDPGDPEAWFHLGRLREENGEPEQAVTAYRQALSLRAPPEISREIGERMGKAEAARSRPDKRHR